LKSQLKAVWILGLAALSLFIYQDPAYAWGAGVHVMQGSLILENLQWIGAALAEILQSFPEDYLYGCLSADIFIGKGSHYHHDHCHNWSVGRRILDAAGSDREVAFAYGYLSHLAADIVAHNIYVPNQLYLTSSTTRWGHIYWEVRAEEYTDRRYWRVAQDLMLRHNAENDAFVQKIVKARLISFQTKKKLFHRAIRLGDLGKRQQADALVSRNSRWDVDGQYIDTLNRISVGLIADFLNHPQNAVCLKYDPIGSDRLVSAKQLRRISRQINGKSPTEGIFKIPSDIAQLAVPPQNFLPCE